MAGERYIGLDVHRNQVTVAGVDEQQTVILKPQKINIAQFETWARSYLQATDKVALEATSNAWEYYDLLSPLVSQALVANPLKLKLITSSRQKTDRHDALVLAKLLAANLLPVVWVPPVQVRELRGLVSHRQQLVEQLRMTKNRLHSVLHRHNLLLPTGDPFSQSNEEWWRQLNLSPVEQLRIRHELRQLEHLEALLKEVELLLTHMSANDTWIEPVTLLVQLPGIAVNSAMIILSAIGEITRFPSASQLVGYAGLGASVHASGETYRTGKVSKQGRRELRTIMVECAWVAVRWSAHWQEQFQNLCRRMSKSKAITAIARKLLVTVWHVLSKQEVDRFADIHAVARSLMTWATQHRLASRLGMKRTAFVQAGLERLQLFERLDTWTYGTRCYSPAGKGIPRVPVPA